MRRDEMERLRDIAEKSYLAGGYSSLSEARITALANDATQRVERMFREDQQWPPVYPLGDEVRIVRGHEVDLPAAELLGLIADLYAQRAEVLRLHSVIDFLEKRRQT